MIPSERLLYGKGGRKEAGGLDLTSEIPDEEYLIPFGQAAVRRQGADLTLVATLLMMHRSLAAADVLAKEGISVEVIDPRTLVPFDEAAVLASVAKTGRLLIVEEDNLTGGWGAEVAARVADAGFDLLDAPIKRLAAYDVPMPFAPVLENFVVPSVERIVESVRLLAQGNA